MALHRRARLLAAALLTTTAGAGLVAAPAQAQSTAVAKLHRAPDGNRVDLTWGDFLLDFTEGSIGSGEAELALIRNAPWRDGAYDNNSNNHSWDRIWFGQAPLPGGGGTRWTVYNGGRYEQFDTTGTLPSGSTLSGSGGSFDYTTSDGTVIGFGDPAGSTGPASNLCNGTQSQCSLLPMTITSPDGKTVTIEWDVHTYCFGDRDHDGENDCSYDTRILSVSNSFGYRIAFNYASSSATFTAPAATAWHQRTGAAFYNTAVSATTPQASVSYAYPSAGVTEVTNTAGEVWRFTGSGDRVTAVRRPGTSSDTTTVGYDTNGAVNSVTREGVTTGYSRSVSGTTGTTTVTDALSHVTSAVSDLSKGVVTSITDANSHTMSYQYDTSGRLTRVTEPEGNYVAYTYDSRGNVTQTDHVPKSGSGLSTLSTYASYDSICSDPVTCNQPNSITDARGNTTDYTYDSTHGGVLTVTAPAPTSGATRPQARYSYTLTNGEYRLTGVSQCQTGSSCSGTTDEVKVTATYNADGSLASVTSGDGSGAVAATTAATYDAVGNLLTVDGPLSGSTDTVRYRYDAGRRLIGTVSPDPDGSGSLKHRAVRNTYTNGLLTKIEQGNVNSQSDTDWAAFSSLQAVETAYDAGARPIIQWRTSGGSIYGLTQTGYDAEGRAICTAVRMNPTDFALPPSNPCAQGTSGSAYGPDRISVTTYDAVDRPTVQTSAYGTTEASNDATLTYTANGAVATVTDAEGNKTSYAYDGFDRLSRTTYPSTTQGAGTSNSSDYEESTFDANSNPLTFRNRAGDTISYTWDALGRPTAKDLPGTEPDLTYTYDLLNRLTGASFTGTSDGMTEARDALGRLTSRTVAMGGSSRAVSYQYDLAGRRTRMTWPDAFFVTYDYLLTGETAHIYEGTSGAALGTYAYDDLGRRTSLTRGNGTTTSYGYDAVSRLTSLAHDVSGTAQDVTFGFAYNPAGQIYTRTTSNDAYAWGGHGSGSTTAVPDGLNRLATVGGTSFSYDTKGNLTSNGVNSYSYSSENRLTSTTNPGSFSTATTMKYDPLGRLQQLNSNYSGFWAELVEDEGGQILMEYSTLSRARRYVFGPDDDEVLAQYFTSPTFNSRTWYVEDERNSVVNTGNDSGTFGTPNRYGDYGEPQSTNGGRFQYTGQYWLVEPSLLYYKNRFYDPKLGRFLQTDPTGYGAGMNMYGYVGGDPVNLVDPTGLEEQCFRTRLGGHHDAYSATVVMGSVCMATSRPSLFFDPNGGSGGGGGSSGEQDPCGDNLGSTLGSARAVIATAQTVLDVASLAAAATGVGAPVAGGLKALSLIGEGAMGVINTYDAVVNGNAGPLAEQGAGLATRLIPGGTLLRGMRVADGRSVFRNALGQFRRNPYNVHAKAINEAEKIAKGRYASGLTHSVRCNPR